MSRWYGYNLILDGEVSDTGTQLGTGVFGEPKIDIIDGMEYDEAFVYYVNDTSETGKMIHLPSREKYSFNINKGKPYFKSVTDYDTEDSIFDNYDYDLTLCGNYM
jgi:hypothetical protein